MSHSISFGPDYSNLPLLPAWYIPGWTSQVPDYTQAPLNPFSSVPFPNLNYVLVTGEDFDFDGNPLGGYFTFMPSDNVTVTSVNPDGSTAYNRIVQRYTGSDLFDQYGYNQAGSGRVYLWEGRLAVLLLATDNTGLMTDQGSPLFYYVDEHFTFGQQYQINAPWNTVGAGPVDIRSLIISGPTIAEIPPIQQISYYSTEDVVANVSSVTNIITNINLAQWDVNFAFTTGFNVPTENDWIEGTWRTQIPPYIASVLIGTQNNGTVLNIGSYTIWVRVVTNSEVPVEKIGTLQITA